MAVVSRSTLKIMNMRPPKQTFASAAASSVNRRDSSSSSGHSATSKSAATELLDVKAGTRLSRHFFTSVTWGYNASSNQLATGGTDGVVMLWDVAMQNTAKSQDRLVHKRAHHDRSVNQVAFAGPSGVWLISAGQDGSIKLWVRMQSDAVFLCTSCSPRSLGSLCDTGYPTARCCDRGCLPAYTRHTR